MENLILKCSKCGKPVQVTPELAAQPVQCPHCKTQLETPTKQDSPPVSQTSNPRFAPIVHGHPLASYGMIVSIIACIGFGVAFYEINSLNERLSEMNQTIFSLRTSDTRIRIENEKAIIDPAQKGYSTCRTNNGIFFISFVDAIPYLDGIKVKLLIGNPMLCSYNGMTLFVNYGARLNSNDEFKYRFGNVNDEDYLKYRNSMKTVPLITLQDTLSPGRWTPVEIVLPSIKTSDFGRLEIVISADQVQLTSSVN